jgi:aspartyl-tRNA(Asn)/glutamyl-tRNA(Gln) amidotransferase subunit A
MKQIPDTWEEQQKEIARGQRRPIEMVKHYLKRIHTHNPRINALTDILAQSAESAEKVLKESATEGPLAGLCLVVKDMIDVTPAHCSGGLDYLKGHKPKIDADIVARLRASGAVVLAVSATDSGGFGVRSPEVVHPLAPELIVGGSSGGSAAAVAAGFSPVAIGTDSGGSIRIPAACCNIIGFKPTSGRVSTRGILPFSPTVDHVGFLSRVVADIQIVMQIADLQFSETDGKNGSPLRIGFAPAYADDAAPEIKKAMERFRQRLKFRGNELRQINLPSPSEIASIHDRIVATEAATSHPTFRQMSSGHLPDVVRKTIAYADTVSRHQYLEACAQKKALATHLQDVFQEVDLVVVPTLPILPPKKSDCYIHLGKNRYHIDDSLRRYTFLFNLTGNPVISLPIQPLKNEIGVSVQLIGPLQADSRLLRYAAQIEQQIQHLES